MLMRLARGSLANRRFAVGLTIFTIAISIALLVLVEQMRGQVRENFQRSVSGVDLIVGAPTAPVQLLLVSVFGLGDPTANVSWSTYEELAEAEVVDWAVPIALGDSYEGFRVVGTTPEFFERFRYAGSTALVIERGTAWRDRFDAVVGARVARAVDLEVGDTIELGHGGGNVTLVTHAAHPFRISGVLAPTGTPVDQSVYVDLAAHHVVHEEFMAGRPLSGFRPPPGEGPASSAPQHGTAGVAPDHGHAHHGGPNQGHAHDEGAHEDGTHDDGTHDSDPHGDVDDTVTPDSVSAIFLGLKARAAAFGLQRRVNEYPDEALLAILPGIALQQLWRITGTVEQVLRVVAGLVVLAGLLGMLTAMLTTLNERRREMAILRACGARPWQVAGLLVLEAAVIVMAGVVLGVLLAWGLQVLLAPWLLARFGIAIAPALPAAELVGVLAGIGAAGVLIALVPALLAYRRTLADGMQVRQ
ncbi:ABC transporter permease [Halomonas denitrificans]|nr:ABC transporter permease [Halomonas denitrificans]